MRIAIIGTGYVGLVSGVCFSDFGHEVVCVDKDADKIAKLEAGEIPIYEPGLDVLLAKNVAEGRLSFTLSLEEALMAATSVPAGLVGLPEGMTPGQTRAADVIRISSDLRRVETLL